MMTDPSPSTTPSTPDAARQVRLARRLARATALLLLAWIAFFGYVMLADPEDIDTSMLPRLIGLGVTYALVVVAIVLAWHRERLAGRMLVAAGLGIFAVILVSGPSPWTTWPQELLGAALLGLPVLIVGYQFLAVARGAGDGTAPGG